MNIVFFGSGEFGLPTLERLAREHRILAVVSQPDRPAGRGGVSMPTPIAAWAAAHLSNVPTIKPEKVGELEVVARIRELAGLDGSPGSPTLRLGSVVSSLSEGNVPADPSRTVFVVIAFGQKMPASLLDGVFAINLHASLLPRCESRKTSLTVPISFIVSSFPICSTSLSFTCFRNVNCGCSFT